MRIDYIVENSRIVIMKEVGSFRIEMFIIWISKEYMWIWCEVVYFVIKSGMI